MQSDQNERGGEVWNIFFFEFLGTFLFLYGCVASQLNSYNIALCYFGVLLLFARLSGGHYNPCVSLCLLIQGEIDAAQCVNYIVPQFLASFATGAIAYLIFDLEKASYFQEDPINQIMGTLIGEVIGATIFFLFIQIQMIKDTCITQNVIVCFAFLAAVFFAAREFTILSDNSLFNPAAAISFSVFQCLSKGNWQQMVNIWIFTAGPLGACVLSSFLYSKVYVASKKSKQ